MATAEKDNEFYRLVGMVAKMAVRVNQETTHGVGFDFSGYFNGFTLVITETKSDPHKRLYKKGSFAQTEQSDVEILREFFRILCAYLDSSVDAEKLLEAA